MTTTRKKSASLLVVIPVGPDDSGADTIDSIFTYCSDDIIILAVDDSKLETTKQFLETRSPKVVRLASAGYPGIRGGLFCSLVNAYQYAYEHYNFDVLLRIDTDALVIGSKPELQALEIFRHEKNVGMLGSYKQDSSGKTRDFRIVAEAIRREASVLGVRSRDRHAVLKGWLKDAKSKGYQVGEHCLGAAVYMNPATITAFATSGLLAEAQVFHDSAISEDHLFSMMTIMAGYSLHDFATGDFPMDLKWKGMPRAPKDVDTNVKKIVHSIKYWQDMTQPEIRTYYRKQRKNYAKIQT